MIEVVNCVSSVFTAIGTIALALFGCIQLSKLNNSLNDSNLMSNLEIEFELNRRKEVMTERRIESEKYIEAQEENFDDKSKEMIKILHSHYVEALENYLNIFDRLCFFLLKRKLNDEDFRTEYREMLSNTISSNELYFRAGSRYRNMLKLNEQWQSK